MPLVVPAAVFTAFIAALLPASGTHTPTGATCQVTDPLSGQCTVYVQTAPSPQPVLPTQPPSNNAGAGAACLWDPAKDRLTTPPAGPVPCNTPYGYWSNYYGCYLAVEQPAPRVGDPAWQGHSPGDGAVYMCYQPQTDMFLLLWLQNPPPPSGGGVTPGQVAQVAIGRMNLSAISIGIDPGAASGRIGLVGMPVWMWAQSPSAQTYGPIAANASAGGITITATARVSAVTWDMGDGSQVTCQGPGTPYVPSDGMRRSPTCGHVYTLSSANQPGGQFTVTATSHWVVTWSGAGQSGTIQLPGLSRSTQITIGEAQVLVQ